MTTNSSPSYLQRSLADLKNYAGLIGALLAMCVLFSFASENFFTLATLSTLSNNIPTLVVMAVGMTFVLIIGGIDLSVGSVMALAASVLSLAVVHWGWPVWSAALLGMFVAALCGARRASFPSAGASPRSSSRWAYWKWRAAWRIR